MHEHKRNLFNFSTIEDAYENNIALIYNNEINPKTTLNTEWNATSASEWASERESHQDTLTKWYCYRYSWIWGITLAMDWNRWFLLSTLFILFVQSSTLLFFHPTIYPWLQFHSFSTVFSKNSHICDHFDGGEFGLIGLFGKSSKSCVDGFLLLFILVVVVFVCSEALFVLTRFSRALWIMWWYGHECVLNSVITSLYYTIRNSLSVV